MPVETNAFRYHSFSFACMDFVQRHSMRCYEISDMLPSEGLVQGPLWLGLIPIEENDLRLVLITGSYERCGIRYVHDAPLEETYAQLRSVKGWVHQSEALLLRTYGLEKDSFAAIVEYIANHMEAGC